MMKAMTCADSRAQALAERYATGLLSEQDTDAFETHLLGCAVCQNEVRFVASARAALRAESRHPLRGYWRAFVGVAAAAAAAFVVIALHGRFQRTADFARLGAVAQPPMYLGVTVRASAPGDSLFAAGMRAYDDRDWTTARRLLAQATAAGAASLPAEFFRAAAALMANDPAAAAAGFARVLDAGDTPYAAESHYYRAKALIRERNVGGARAELLRVPAAADALVAQARALADTLAALESATPTKPR